MNNPSISDVIRREVKPMNFGVKNPSILCPSDVGHFIWKETKEFSNYDDGHNSVESILIESMLGYHISNDARRLIELCKLFYTVMKGRKPKDSIYAGDMDVYLHILVDTKKKVVYHVSNSCSCADVVDWLIVWDRDEISDVVHVRNIHKKSDYPKSNYPDKLGLKFYKDRNYVIDYVEKYHMTNLGGVYGDIRDKGYVISLTLYNEENDFGKSMNKHQIDKDNRHLYHFYSAYKHAMWSIDMLADKIKSGEEL